jgi:hypothetical protein
MSIMRIIIYGAGGIGSVVGGPVNEKLLQISQEMAASHDKPGKYTVKQLCSILGINAAEIKDG